MTIEEKKKLKLEKDSSKIEALINASLKLFATNSYDNISTDMLVKEAKVSKGLLFYHFDSKEKFYKYLYDYSIQETIKLVNKYTQENEKQTDDFFEMCMDGIKFKQKLMFDNPLVYFFLLNVVQDKSPIVRKIINPAVSSDTRAHLQSVADKSNLDMFKNKDDVPYLIDIIDLTSKGNLKKFIDNPDMDIAKESVEYLKLIEVLRNNFYKEEYI